jgi:hypothetical protein
MTFLILSFYGEKAPWEIFGDLDGEEEEKHYIFQDVQIPVTIVPAESPTVQPHPLKVPKPVI